MRIEKIELKNTGYGNQKVILTAYIQERVGGTEDFLRPAVIICPGGGYEFTTERESEPVALAFMEKGYQAFVLDYTVLNQDEKKELMPHPLYNLAEAVHYVRSNRKEFKVDGNKISIMGFSAGGHLCAMYCGVYAQEWFVKQTRYSEEEMKPNYAVLCYPVIDFSLGWPETKKQIFSITSQPGKYKAQELISAAKTPPTFIWHTVSDEGVPVQNTLQYVQKLEEHKINFECHLFHRGRHGLSLANAQSAKIMDETYINPHAAKWFSLMIEWLNEHYSNWKVSKR